MAVGCSSEFVCVDIVGSNRLRFVCCYLTCTGGTQVLNGNMKVFLEELETLMNVDGTLIVGGDFNLPGVSWSEGIGSCSGPDHSKEKMLNE